MKIEKIIEVIEPKKAQRLVIAVPASLHTDIKIRAIMRGTSVRKYVMRAIVAQIAKENEYQ